MSFPRAEISFVTAPVAPYDEGNHDHQGGDPMMMPSMVKKERIYWRRCLQRHIKDCTNINPPPLRGRSMMRMRRWACLATMIVMGDENDGSPGRRESRENSFMISAPVLESRFPVGSSASRMAGLVTSARATATRCCCTAVKVPRACCLLRSRKADALKRQTGQLFPFAGMNP
jgi:hypothetical protein